ncbi:MAG: TonB-dependent receptor plug domain-containing protein [Bacteroidota bacterium]
MHGEYISAILRESLCVLCVTQATFGASSTHSSSFPSFSPLSVDYLRFVRQFVTFLLLFLGLSTTLRAQAVVDTLLELPAATVSEQLPLLISAFTERTAITTYHATQSAANLLAQDGGIYLKSYGPGTLATPSVRGGNASQVVTLWEGLPVQSPQSGVLDLSLVQGLGFGALELTSGGTSTTVGSGALSGAIQLRAAELPMDGWRSAVGASIGSFGLQSQQASLGQGRGAWQWQVSASQQQATNDFVYRIPSTGEERQQTHAANHFWSTQQQARWQPNARHQLRLLLWQQAGDRQLPPRTTSTNSVATQFDQSWRQQLHWQYTNKNTVWRTQLAYFRDKLLYTDPNALLRPARSGFRSYLLKSQRAQQLNAQWRITTGVLAQHSRAFADGYPNARDLTDVSLWQTVDWNANNGWQFHAAGRLVYTSEDEQLVVGQIRVGKHWRTHEVTAHLSRDYRLPTLNDRYWIPGGQPDLLTELSWEQSIQWKMERTLNAWSWSLRVPIYQRWTDNWLQWSIREGESNFSASNIAKVKTQGIEPQLDMSRQWAKQKLTLQLRYFGGSSTYQTAVENPRIAVGDQLPYVPRHRVHTHLEWQAPHWSLRYTHQWNGATSGLSAELPAYALGQVRATGQWQWKQLRINTFLQIDNLWETSYRVIEFRAMPGRGVQLGATFQWN